MESPTHDVRIKPGYAYIIPMADGRKIRVVCYRSKGRLIARFYDAASGEPVQTIPAEVDKKRGV